MTREEYDLWLAETKKSETRWVLDTVYSVNNGGYFAYKGGVESGIFVEADQKGVVSIGTYEGAMPCITDAMFKVQHEKKVGNSASDALTYALEKMGLDMLLDLILG